jgi:protein-S-isoprenylcysteine O-methyltransferase Ste14
VGKTGLWVYAEFEIVGLTQLVEGGLESMQQPEEHPAALRMGVIVLFFAGLAGLAGFAVGLGAAFDDWGRLRLGWLSPLLGASLFLAGAVLVVWSVYVQYSLGKGTPAPAVATRRLVTSGPYAWTRNPMTLGALMLYLGIGAWIESGAVIGLTLAVGGALLTFIDYHETRELTERFGAEYLAYRQCTPFLLPRCRWLGRS